MTCLETMCIICLIKNSNIYKVKHLHEVIISILHRNGIQVFYDIYTNLMMCDSLILDKLSILKKFEDISPTVIKLSTLIRDRTSPMYKNIFFDIAIIDMNQNICNMFSSDAVYLSRDVYDNINTFSNIFNTYNNNHVKPSSCEYYKLYYYNGAPLLPNKLENDISILVDIISRIDHLSVAQSVLEMLISIIGYKLSLTQVIHLIEVKGVRTFTQYDGSYQPFDKLYISSPLISAVKYDDNIDRIRKLIDSGANINVLDSNCNSALYYALYNKKYIHINMLLDITLELYYRDIKSNVIHWCVRDGNIEILKIILDKGIDINIKNVAGLTPLDIALDWNRLEHVKVLSCYKRNI